MKELSRTSVLAQQAWVAARKNNDFPAFKPLLEKMFALLKASRPTPRATAAVATTARSWMISSRANDVVRGGRAWTRCASGWCRWWSQLARAAVRRISNFSRGIIRSSRSNNSASSEPRKSVSISSAAGWMSRRIRSPRASARTIAGSQLATTSTFFRPRFSRSCTKRDTAFTSKASSRNDSGLPPGETLSLGIHESQSRMWEIQVGRSPAFWEYFFPLAQAAFPAALGGEKLDDFYLAIHDVRPTLIRVEADEATYNLHILYSLRIGTGHHRRRTARCRFADAWNEKYRQFLGITPPTDADGVLQDIHWRPADLGYFATYSLGNMYAS